MVSTETVTLTGSASLAPGDHLAWFPDCDKATQAGMLAILTQGLSLGDEVVMVQEPGNSTDLPVDHGRLSSGAQLTMLRHEEFFLREGRPAPDSLDDRIEELMSRAHDRGATGLRLLVSMDWTTHDREALLRFEDALSQACRRHGCIVICRFDRHATRDGQILEDALACHPKLLVGRAVHENLLHVPSDDLLGGNAAPARLDRQLHALSRAGADRQAMQRDRAFLSAVLDSVRALVVVLDRKGRVVRFNRAAARAAGYSEEEMLGRLFWDRVLQSEDRTRARDMFRRIKGGETPPPYSDQWVARDGRRIEMTWTAQPLRDENGGVSHILATGIDITAQRAAEQSLQKSEIRYRRLLDALQEGVWAVDERGHTTFVNARLARMLGHSAEEMLGKHLFEFVDDRDLDQARRNLQRRRRGIREEFDFRFLRRDGRLMDALVATAPVLGEDGSYRGAVAGIVDITEQRVVEEARRWEARGNASMAALSSMLISPSPIEELSTLVLEHAQRLTDSPIGYVGHVDPASGALNCTTLANEAWADCGIEGWQAVQPEFMGLGSWLPDNNESLMINDVSRDPRSKGAPEGHIGIQRLLCSPALLGDEVVGQLALANAEREYRDRDRVVLERLAVLYALAVGRHRQESALRQQAEELRGQNRDLDTFARTVAHDLRTPLTTLLSVSQLLGMSFTTMNEEKRDHCFEMMERNARRMDRIINELLLLARVRKASVEPEPVEMGKVVGEALDRLHLAVEDAGATISMPDQWPAAMGHAPWLEEVWVNYLDNALKHTGEAPRVTLGAKERPDGTVRYWVQDRGPGLGEGDQERVFDAFERSSATQSIAGIGLGLNIVSIIIERLNGQVGVQSVPGEGCTFHFTLPAAPG